MSTLRHPVVITTLEEDFRRLGLITESEANQEPELEDELDEREKTKYSGSLGKGRSAAVRAAQQAGLSKDQAAELVQDWEEGWGVLNAPKDKAQSLKRVFMKIQQRFGEWVEEELDDEDIEEGAKYRTVGKKTLPKSKGGKTGTGSPGKNQGANAIDKGTEDVDDELDDDTVAFAEALAFAEDFDSAWEALGEEGIETVYFDNDGMDELEKLSEEVVELPAGIVEMEDDDEEEPVFEDEGEESEIDEEEEEEQPYQNVAEALNAIEELAQVGVGAAEDAVPVFANIALIAETLYDSFTSHAAITEDKDFDEIAEAYADMAKYAAAAVSVFQEDEDFDLDAIHETLNDLLDALMEGVEAYVALLDEEDEGLDEDEEDEGLDDEEGLDEYDEEGNE
jgi:hypothetical protein